MHCFIAVLLWTVELNPGPKVSPLTFASWNFQSAVNKAALVHDIIRDHNIDILALNETWITSNLPPAISDDIAPTVYRVQHVRRGERTRSDQRRGGGLVFIHRESLTVRRHFLDDNMRPTSYEVQLVKLSTSQS